MDSPAEAKKKGGGKEEEIKDSHSTPWIVNTDSCFIFKGRKRGLLVGLCPFSLFFCFTTGIRNLRINPTCR